MPGFGDKSSASVSKMELGGARYGGKARFSFGNIIGDPFWLGSISIGVCGWLIAFVSSIIANIELKYPNYAWWTLVYMLFCIGGVIYVVGSNTVTTYHVALSSFLAAGLVMTTSAVNSLIYESNAAKEAGAAGFILLSIDAIVWVFYFGSQPESSHRQTLSSFALHNDHAPSRTSRANMRQSYRPDTNTSTQHAAPLYTTSHLAGFETSSPVAGFPSNGGVSNRQSAAVFPAPVGGAGAQSQSNNNFPGANNNANNPGSVAPTVTQESVTAPSEYPYRAKAIYNYEANPDDANEISFSKHEILDVSDVSGRWWQAKKENGETGIAPSNYLILL